ncbi:hypothetical protein PJI17_01150 [Mycobacterium kansasii]
MPHEALLPGRGWLVVVIETGSRARRFTIWSSETGHIAPPGRHHGRACARRTQYGGGATAGQGSGIAGRFGTHRRLRGRRGLRCVVFESELADDSRRKRRLARVGPACATGGAT